MAPLGKALLLLALPALALAKVKCNATEISSTTYTVQNGQTLYEIAVAANRSLCDVARLNRMADPTYINVGDTVLIPENNCNPTDVTSCLLTESTNPRLCILGGPHAYLTVLNDTIRYVALNKLNITVAALQNGGPTGVNVSDPDAILPPGSRLKVPICANSVCTIKPYSFEYGVLQDLAIEYKTTVGQIEAINSGFYHSVGTATNPYSGPTIVLPVKCHCPAGKDCTRVLT